MKSSFAEHLLENNHSYTSIENNMTILEYGEKGESLNCKEDFHIYVNAKLDSTNLLNTTHTGNINPIFEYITKIRKH